MNKNVNVFIAVLLCALLCGGVMWLRMASEEKLGWNIQDTYSASPAYSSGASYSDATFVGPSSGGMMSVTSSRRFLRTRAASSYAGAYSSAATQPLTSHLSPLTSHLSPHRLQAEVSTPLPAKLSRALVVATMQVCP